MNVFIKLTSASPNTGPFNLYSDVDGYVSPFETNIAKNSLISGYISTLVPDLSTAIRIYSEGSCGSYITITIVQPTTSTTTSTTTLLFTTSTTTTSSTSSTTTTTSTTLLPIYTILIAKTISGIVEGLCGLLYNNINVEDATVLYFQSGSSTPIVGQQLYTDNLCTIPYIGDDAEWGGIISWDVDYDNVFNSVVGVNLAGELSSITSCASVTTTTSSTITTTTTAIPEYHVEMCVNDPTYNTADEENIPYIPSPVLVYTPTKAGYNYLFFSIPIDRSFVIKDALSVDVTSSFAIDTASGASGVDVRTGYYNNYIYKSNDVYATSYSIQFTLTLS